jgi:hypothetical protein
MTNYMHNSNATKSELPHLPGELVKHLVAQRKPGILDRISSCQSSEAAHTMWHEFLDHANEVSQKTINRAQRLLATLDFPQP